MEAAKMSGYLKDVKLNNKYLKTKSKAKIYKTIKKHICITQQKLAQIQLEQNNFEELQKFTHFEW